MKKPKDKAKIKDKENISNYLETVGRLSKHESNILSLIYDNEATYEQVSESVKAGLR